MLGSLKSLIVLFLKNLTILPYGVNLLFSCEGCCASDSIAFGAAAFFFFVGGIMGLWSARTQWAPLLALTPSRISTQRN
jgi:hypothetical protein